MPLTTLQKCKDYLQITSITDDQFITNKVNEVQAIIESYCHRHFDLNTYTSEQHIINHKIFTNEYPIVSVSSIFRYDDNILNYVPEENGMTNYRIFKTYIEMLDWKYVTMTGRIRYANIEESYAEITYTAGYDSDSIPPDLTSAATELVALKYKESRENRLGVEAESEGGVKYTYSKKDSEMPLSISCVLDRYKKVRC